MRHRNAVGYLPELGTGSLDRATEQALVRHAESCRACQGWVETRDLLAVALHDDREEHPESDLLALCAVRPEEIHEPDREEIRIHLQRCRVCRDELEFTRRAVRQARPSAETAARPGALSWSWQSLPHAARAIAAVLAVILLGASLFAGGVLFGRIAATEDRLAVGPGPGPRSHQSEELSGRDLEGTHVLGAEGRLVVSKLTVKSGADITFRAGDSVAFGDGFRVLAGARVRAGSASPAGTSAPTTPDGESSKHRNSNPQARGPEGPP